MPSDTVKRSEDDISAAATDSIFTLSFPPRKFICVGLRTKDRLLQRGELGKLAQAKQAHDLT
jgi:hypothetical protein